MKKNKDKELQIDFTFNNGSSDLIIRAFGYKGRTDTDENGTEIIYPAQINKLQFKFDTNPNDGEFRENNSGQDWQDILFLHNFTKLISLAQEAFENFEPNDTI